MVFPRRKPAGLASHDCRGHLDIGTRLYDGSLAWRHPAAISAQLWAGGGADVDGQKVNEDARRAD